jgi:hypothetical protein
MLGNRGTDRHPGAQDFGYLSMNIDGRRLGNVEVQGLHGYTIGSWARPRGDEHGYPSAS